MCQDEMSEMICRFPEITQTNKKGIKRQRKTYKSKNTKTLGIDNEHFKSLLKDFQFQNGDLICFLTTFDHFLVKTYMQEFKSILNHQIFFVEINENFENLSKRTINNKYTSDNTFRNESLNCKLITHALMFCSLILSYLLNDTKIKVTLKDKNKKSVDYIKNIFCNNIQDLYSKHTNRLIDHIPREQSSLINQEFFSMKLKDFLDFYYKSNAFKLLIYENSYFYEENNLYFLDYASSLIKQSQSILCDRSKEINYK
jgi:hypothetical protein